MKLIKLTQGFSATIDDNMEERVSYFRWCVQESTPDIRYYAVTNMWKGSKELKLYMHQLIMGTPIDKVIDHKNGDGLDNRVENLRICSYQQNSLNSRCRSGCTSKYRGVSWYKFYNKWTVYISINRKHTSIGNFENEVDAALAYNEKAIKYHGEFARLNII